MNQDDRTLVILEEQMRTLGREIREIKDCLEKHGGDISTGAVSNEKRLVRVETTLSIIKWLLGVLVTSAITQAMVVFSSFFN